MSGANGVVCLLPLQSLPKLSKSNYSLRFQKPKKTGLNGLPLSKDHLDLCVLPVCTFSLIKLRYPCFGQAYENLSFRLGITFPPNYPYAPPVCTFVTRCWHPNVDLQGNICLDILKVNKLSALVMSTKLPWLIHSFRITGAPFTVFKASSSRFSHF